MAVSGSFSKSIVSDHYTLRVDWTAAQSVSANTSTITAKIYLVIASNWPLNIGARSTNSITIAGTKYSFSSSAIDTNGGITRLLATVTSNPIAHNSDGTKSISMSCSFAMNATISGTYYGTMTATASVTLDKIARASSLTVANGTLGEGLTLKVNSPSSNFKYTIGYNANGSAVYDPVPNATETSSTSISWTPSVELAKYNTTGTSVTLYFLITTYYNGNAVGTSKTTTTCVIPESVKPSCSISVTDPTGYLSTYGSYIKGLSKFKITVTPTLAYESPISTYRTTANGISYTAASFTTGTLNTSGTLKISSTVKDKRGRSGTGSTSVNVLNYIEPVVSILSVKRCNEDASENDQGEYVLVTMSAAVTSLNNKNSARYLLKYKKSTDSTYTEVGLDNYTDVYSIAGVTYLFEADTGSSYDVELEVTDNFKTITRATSASTAFTLMHWGDDGSSMAIGKIAEEPYLLDIGLPTRFNQPVYGNVMGLNTLPELPRDSDFNKCMAIGCWAVYRNDDAKTMANIPVSAAGRLEVSAATGEGIRLTGWSYVRQRFIPYSLNYPTYERDISRDDTNDWVYGEWVATNLSNSASTHVYREPTALWTGTRYMTGDHTNNLSEAISKQPNGIVLVFSRYVNGAADDSNFNSFFVSKHTVAAHPGIGHQFCMNAVNFSYITSKYLYISDTAITGNDFNSAKGTNNGVTYDNSAYVLRYVIGV